MLNYGFGFNVWLSETVGLVYQGGTKKEFKAVVPTHYQHSLGVVIKFGGTDTDGDGIYDKYDSCPVWYTKPTVSDNHTLKPKP